MADHLIFQIGSLGDAMMTVPALHALRRNFLEDRFILLSNRGSASVFGPEVFEGSGLFEKVLEYSSGSVRFLGALENQAQLWKKIKALRPERLSYLVPSLRIPHQVFRDKLFFRSAGIRQLFGFKGFVGEARRATGFPLSDTVHEADRLTARLALDGLTMPSPGEGCMDLQLGEREREVFEAWRGRCGSDMGRHWLAVAPFSNKSVARWPMEWFMQLVQGLARDHNVWPVVFGAEADRKEGERMITGWGAGFNAAGHLDVRSAAYALGRCRIYVGNDTGPIHLAAAVGLPCVGIYGAYSEPGKWHPYGKGHRVIRLHPECEGCGLSVCLNQGNRCLLEIGIDTVRDCFEDLWKATKPAWGGDA